MLGIVLAASVVVWHGSAEQAQRPVVEISDRCRGCGCKGGPGGIKDPRELYSSETASVPPTEASTGSLGGVDEFEPVSCGSNMNHADEALGELVVSSSNGAVDFQSAKHPFD